MTDVGHPRREAAKRAAHGRPSLAAILTVAGEIASVEGLERLSMRRLATATGMSKSGIYAHFASMEELQLATIKHARDVFEAEVLRDDRADAGSGLGALLDRWLAYYENRVFPGGCFFIAGAVDFAGRPGAVRDALEGALDWEVEALEAAVRKARETGELHSEEAPRQTAFGLHSILLHAQALFQVKRDPVVFERARAAVRRILL